MSAPAVALALAFAAPLAVPAGVDDCATVQPGVPSPAAVFARFSDVAYTGPSVKAHCGQRYNVFVPDGEPPAEGWPVLVVLDLAGFRTSRRYTWLDPLDPPQHRTELAYLAVTDDELPMVVVWASATVSRGGSSGNELDDPAYDPFAQPPQYGAGYPGNGVFVPPGVLPPGFLGLLPPYVDGKRPMPEKDAVMLIQHVKHHAQSFPPGADEPLRLDLSRLAVSGSSAGAMTLAWCVLGPDRAAQTHPVPVPGSQEARDTRVAAAVLHGPTLFLPRLVQDDVSFPTGVHLPVMAGAAGTPYDEPAQALSESALYQDDSSSLLFADDGPAGEHSWANARQALLLTYVEASSVPPPLCFALDPLTGEPDACWFAQDVELSVHSSWHGHALKTRFPNAYLVASSDAAYDRDGFLLDQGTGAPAIADLVVPAGVTNSELAAHQMAWLRAVLGGPPGEWDDLGVGASAGSQDLPQLEGDGWLRPLSPIALRVRDARPGSPVALVIGFTRVDLPVAGGLLVPSPDVIGAGLPHTDAHGRLVLSTLWPHEVPVGLELVFQAWVADEQAAFGLASTNAIRARAP